MSADLNTFIELEGSLEEIEAMLTVIKDYIGQKHDASLDFPRISTKRKFDGENNVSYVNFAPSLKPDIKLSALLVVENSI